MDATGQGQEDIMTVPWDPKRTMYPHRLMVTEDILEKDSDDIEMLEAEIDQLQRENRGLAGDLSRAKMNKALMLWQVCAYHEERMRVAIETARAISAIAKTRPMNDHEIGEFERMSHRATLHADILSLFAKRGAYSELWKTPPGGDVPELTPPGKQIIPARPWGSPHMLIRSGVKGWGA